MEKDEAEKEHKEHRIKFKRDLDIKSQVRDGLPQNDYSNERYN